MSTNKVQLTYKLGGDLEINRLGYGGMQLTGEGVFGDAPDRENAIKVLQAAVAGGVNFLDTADSYGPHTNEVLFHDALKNDYDKIVIATKGGLTRPGPNVWVPNGNPEYIAQAIEDSLQRLQLKQIQLWQLHRVDPNFPIEETLKPVADAVKAGKIKHVGLSEVGIEEIEKAQKIVPIASVQNLYNLSERKWESIVDYTEQNNIAFIPWFPLASGPDKLKDKITHIAEAHNATVSQIALAWLLKRAANILLIPGTKSLHHLQDNLKAADIVLTDEEFEQLSK
ncbi:oxidoreductase [Arachidicoccus ginsenosidimutans]|uniref:aldo/keto reductase n=1 Tax=Arachidicoccus sp. BS20 TaxID=1850526 RepID=UPI0007F06987|nr:aldo/keto reductase [Arachidicoccus sp. BS20]ANI88494.1 oxidoreductase [Arachidicoccus sp. BS20]